MHGDVTLFSPAADDTFEKLFSSLFSRALLQGLESALLSEVSS
jgi:hypothetical protein